MAYQPDRLARVRARVVQGFMQGLNPGFPRLCKGCNGSAHPCLTCVCARTHRRSHLRVRVRLPETLATLATLAHSLSILFPFSDLAVRDRARVTQGLGQERKGSTPKGGWVKVRKARAARPQSLSRRDFFPTRAIFGQVAGVGDAVGSPETPAAIGTPLIVRRIPPAVRRASVTARRRDDWRVHVIRGPALAKVNYFPTAGCAR